MPAAIRPMSRISRKISVDGPPVPDLRRARSRRFSSVSLCFWKSRGADLGELVMVVHRFNADLGLHALVPIRNVFGLVPIWNVRPRYVEYNRVDSVAGLRLYWALLGWTHA